MRRKHVFTNGEIYHLINRGILKNDIYKHSRDYWRFLDVLNYYRFFDLPMRFSHYIRENIKQRSKIIKKLEKDNKKYVDILCYCLMPNHFHLLVKQLTTRGISTFMKHVEDSYVRYFNVKYKRKGTLFESSFKSIRIEDDEQLVHVSRYIHLNPVSSHLIRTDENKYYSWSSHKDYLDQSKSDFINKTTIQNYFKNRHCP